jgi:hypothetical protein
MWLVLALLSLLITGGAGAQDSVEPPPSSDVQVQDEGADPLPGGEAPVQDEAVLPTAESGQSDGSDGSEPDPQSDIGHPPSEELLLQRLVRQGLENVTVRRDRNSEIRVGFENRRYRWNLTGLGVVLAAAAREAPEGAVLVVTPKQWGVPEFQVRVAADDYRRFLDGELSEKELAPRFKVSYSRGGAPSGGANRSFGRADLTAGIGFRASFTTEDPDEGLHGRFLAGLEGSLLPGIGVTAQQMIPLGEESPELTQARIGGVLHPAASVFLAAAGGRLTEDMDAVQGEVGWFARSGQTSARLTYTAGRDRFFARDSRSALLTVTQWVGRRDIAVSLVGGRFWDGDRGAEILLQSGFRERRFIVGGGRSGGVTRTRIQVVLPLGPRVHSEPKTVRFKIRDTFNARYRAPKGLVTEALVGGVVPPSLLEERAMIFSPEIVRTYLKELRRSADLLQ